MRGCGLGRVHAPGAALLLPLLIACGAPEQAGGSPRLEAEAPAPALALGRPGSLPGAGSFALDPEGIAEQVAAKGPWAGGVAALLGLVAQPGGVKLALLGGGLTGAALTARLAERLGPRTCGGSLIAPQLVLTSAACGTRPLTAFTTRPGQPLPLIGAWPQAVRHTYVAPGESPAAAGSGLALVVLSGALDEAPLAHLVGDGTAAAAPVAVGGPVWVAGYGLYREARGLWPRDRAGRRHVGRLVVEEVDEDGFVVASSPAQICVGDEGSGVYLAAADGRTAPVLVGVVGHRLPLFAGERLPRCAERAYVDRLAPSLAWLTQTRADVDDRLRRLAAAMAADQD